ncbi:hypothetical protein FCV25MIE_31996 [Fagus crenata]
MPYELFFVGYGPTTPNPDRCQSAQDVLKQADTTEKRRVFVIVSNILQKHLIIGLTELKQFPQLCKIDAWVPIDPDMDCKS